MSAIGDTLEALSATIANRRDAGDTSYTYRLLTGKPDELLKKVMEEAGEVALAGKDLDQLLGGLKAHRNNPNVPTSRVENMERRVDAARDHLRYEIADVAYHSLVMLEKYGISLDDLSAELNARMAESERPENAQVMDAQRINRGH